MERDEPANFDSTRWTLIEQVHGDADTRRQALEELLTRYVPALRAHLVVRRRMQPQDAADLVQEFVTNKILERDLVARADRTRGKFRGFLLTALDRFVIDWIRYTRAKKRAAPDTVSIDGDRCDPADSPPADVFDVAWGQMVLGESLKLMRRSCDADDAEKIWLTFYWRVLRPLTTGAPPLDYAELVHRCGFETPRQASNALITARRRFNRCLREVVSEYTGSDEEISEEIDDLQRILSAEEAWRRDLVPAELSAIVDTRDIADGDIEGTLGRDVSDLLAVTPQAEPEWQPRDLGPVLRHLLATPLSEVCLWTDRAPTNPGWTLRSTGELLSDPQPPLELLTEMKRTGQSWAKEDSESIPRDVGANVYFASIAAAMVRLNQRISSSSDETLRSGFEKLIGCPWMDPELGRLMSQALQELER